jgi:multiple sugar transport system permease protein
MLSTSLKTLDKTMEFPPQFIPNPIVPGNYWEALTSPKMDFPLFTRNTLIIAVLTVAGTVISSAIVAYGFSKINFKGRGVLFAIMLATMMVPFPVMMVSLFSIFRWMTDNTPIQWMGTFKPLWVPAWFGSAFNIFLLRQFFMTIPDELSESARIDGCSEWGIFSRIVLPLARPALAVVALFTFMGVWNDFLGPLVYLQYPSNIRWRWACKLPVATGRHSVEHSHGGVRCLCCHRSSSCSSWRRRLSSRASPQPV